MPEVRPTRWTAPPRSPSTEAKLVSQFGVHPIIAAILVARGITEPGEVDRYLYPTYEHLSDAHLLPDFDKAVAEILAAKESGGLVYVHGDYDVDGVTSAALLDRFLRKIGCKVYTHVPHRFKEGYGIHGSAVEAAIKMGATLFMTCDCGSNALSQIEAAAEAGMRVVVTDHHLIGGDWPKAHAFVNPKRPDSQYPYADLSGVGVVFRLCEGVTEALGMPVENYRKHHVEFAALGTIADVMPLTGDNRIIARMGLQALNASTKKCIQALLRHSREAGPITAKTVGFVLAPRLNAAGRIEDAELSLRLLMTSDDAVADKLAEEIEVINRNRKAEQDRIFAEALEMIETQGLGEKAIIVVANAGWHLGVVGVVAGKLRERYNRPAFVLSFHEEDQVWKGSGRSIDAFHLADAIQAHGDLMSGGGHAKAAGCHFDKDNLEAVQKALEAYAGSKLSAEDLELVCSADVEVEADDLDGVFFQELALLEPCGMGNPKPRLAARGTIGDLKPTKTDEHWQLRVKTARGSSGWFTAFGLRKTHGDLAPGTPVEVVFKPEVEEYKGTIYHKWKPELVLVMPEPT